MPSTFARSMRKPIDAWRTSQPMSMSSEVIRGHQGFIRGHQGSSGVISGTRLAHVPANEHVSIYRAHEPRECDEQLHLMREAITC